MTWGGAEIPLGVLDLPAIDSLYLCLFISTVCSLVWVSRVAFWGE